MNFAAYEAQANSVDINTITINDKINREILHRLRANDPTLTEVGITDIEAREQDYYNAERHRGAEAAYEETRTYYCPTNTNELGWIGYFIGRNSVVDELTLFHINTDNIRTLGEANIWSIFGEGMSYNRSIDELSILGMRLTGDLISSLEPFIINSRGLTEVTMESAYSSIDHTGYHHLASAFSKCMNKCLREITLTENEIDDEDLVHIIEAIGTHPQLKELLMSGNDAGQKTCNALRNILLQPTTALRCLEVGWLGEDELLCTLVSGLVGNCRLKTLSLHGLRHISDKGWNAISRLLCDTSSINNTYMSNHTLSRLEKNYEATKTNGIPECVRHRLSLNGRHEDKRRIAMQKILYYHSDFDMQPFFEWEFKALPIAIDWFTKAAAQTTGFEEKINRTKLSAIYQFVRDMPVLYVEAHLRKDLEDIKAKESLLEEEAEQLRRQLQDIPHRRQILHDQKKSIIEKLG